MNLDEMLKESAPPTMVVDAGQSSILRTEVGKVPGECTVLGNKATAIRMAWSYNNMLKLMDLAASLANKVINTGANPDELPPYPDAYAVEEFVNELKNVNVHVY